MKVDIIKDLKERHMTKMDLVRALKVSRPGLETWIEKGEIPDTYGNYINNYCKIMGIPLPAIPNITYSDMAAFRRFINLSRPIVANYVGISLDHLNRFENGKIELDDFSKAKLIELYKAVMLKEGKYVGYKQIYDDIVVTEYLFDIEVAAPQSKALQNRCLTQHIINSNKNVTYNCVFSVPDELKSIEKKVGEY